MLSWLGLGCPHSGHLIPNPKMLSNHPKPSLSSPLPLVFMVKKGIPQEVSQNPKLSLHDPPKQPQKEGFHYALPPCWPRFVHCLGVAMGFGCFGGPKQPTHTQNQENKKHKHNKTAVFTKVCENSKTQTKVQHTLPFVFLTKNELDPQKNTLRGKWARKTKGHSFPCFYG